MHLKLFPLDFLKMDIEVYSEIHRQFYYIGGAFCFVLQYPANVLFELTVCVTCPEFTKKSRSSLSDKIFKPFSNLNCALLYTDTANSISKLFPLWKLLL